MKWSIYIGSIKGIRLQVHLTFLLLLLYVAFVGLAEARLSGAVAGVLFICALFVCVILHELSHSFTAMQFGVKVESITLLPIGGVAAMRSIPEGPGEELLVSVVGPMTSVGIFAVLAAVLRPSLDELSLDNINTFATELRPFFVSLMIVNLWLGIFNLLPAFPMDGGRVLRGFLALVLPYEIATRIAVVIGQVLAAGLVVLGFYGNFWLVLIGFFIFIGASSESQRLKLRVALARVHAADVMTTTFRTLAPEDPVGLAFPDLLHGFQDHFPVTREGRFVGLLTRPNLVGLFRTNQMNTSAGQVMTTGLPVLDPGANLQHAWEAMVEHRSSVLPVVSGEYLVGLVTQEGIDRYFQMQRLLRG